MNIIRDFIFCPSDCKGAAIALGNFDGLHLGHQVILKQTIALAKSYGTKAAVMTFEPHPREFFSKDKQGLRIHSFRQKIELLEKMGIDIVFAVRFNATLAAMSAESFVTELLQRQLAAKQIITGYNFAFGHKRSGDTAFLSDMAKKHGFGFTACPPVEKDGQAVSSSAIRQLLTEGNVKSVSGLLGRPYQIAGHVRHGEKRGRQIGFPTANVPLTKLFKARFGVYAVRLEVDGQWHKGVANLGVKPTFGHKEPLLEVHAFDIQPELYGKLLRVELMDFIREEKRFDGIEALKNQIGQDCQKAKELLA